MADEKDIVNKIKNRGVIYDIEDSNLKKYLNQELEKKQNKLSFRSPINETSGIVTLATDTTVTDSTNPIQSGAVKNALKLKADKTELGDYTKTVDLPVSNWNETDQTSKSYIQNKPTTLGAFTNDQGFITNTVDNLTNYYTTSNTYSKTEVDTLLSAISSLKIEKVTELPTENISKSTIYLLPKTTAQTNNIYDEYIYVKNKDDENYHWELIGDTTVDLSGYLTAAETLEMLNGKESKITTLPITKGGTGANTVKAAQYNLLSSMNSVESNLSANDEIVVAYDENSKSEYNGALHTRKLSTISNYVKSLFNYEQKTTAPFFEWGKNISWDRDNYTISCNTSQNKNSDRKFNSIYPYYSDCTIKVKIRAKCSVCFGLSNTKQVADYGSPTNIKYSFSLMDSGTFNIYENNKQYGYNNQDKMIEGGTYPAYYNDGDEFRIEKTGTTIKYYRNNNLERDVIITNESLYGVVVFTGSGNIDNFGFNEIVIIPEATTTTKGLMSASDKTTVTYIKPFFYRNNTNSVVYKKITVTPPENGGIFHIASRTQIYSGIFHTKDSTILSEILEIGTNYNDNTPGTSTRHIHIKPVYYSSNRIVCLYVAFDSYSIIQISSYASITIEDITADDFNTTTSSKSVLSILPYNQLDNKYLLLSGGTLDSEAFITSRIDNESYLRYSKLSYAGLYFIPENRAKNKSTAQGIYWRDRSNITTIGSFGAKVNDDDDPETSGSVTKLEYYFIGKAWNDYIVKIDNKGNTEFNGSVTSSNFIGNASSATNIRSGRINIQAVDPSSGTDYRNARITIDQLIDYLISIKKIDDSNAGYYVINCRYSHSSNNVMQFVCDGINYEVSFSGAWIEVFGYCKSGQGLSCSYKVRIHVGANQNFTVTSGYNKVDNATIIEYCYNADNSPQKTSFRFIRTTNLTFSGTSRNPMSGVAIQSELDKKQNKLTAGSGITIEGNEISAQTTSVATSLTLGTIKLGSDTKQTVAANAVTTKANRTYAVQLNSSNQAVVNVPWVDTQSGDTNYTIGMSGNTLTLTGTDGTTQTIDFSKLPYAGNGYLGSKATTSARYKYVILGKSSENFKILGKLLMCRNNKTDNYGIEVDFSVINASSVGDYSLNYTCNNNGGWAKLVKITIDSVEYIAISLYTGAIYFAAYFYWNITKSGSPTNCGTIYDYTSQQTSTELTYSPHYFKGTINGTITNATNATNATNDKNGNDITTSYMPLEEISNTYLPERLKEYRTTAETDENNNYTISGKHRAKPSTTSKSPFYNLHTNAADFMLDVNSYSTQWASQIATDYRTNHLAVRNLNNGTWNNWRFMLGWKPNINQDLTEKGYWAGMSTTTGISSKWYHVLSMDWDLSDSNMWISQLLLPTHDSDNKSCYFRYNKSVSKSEFNDWIKILDSNNYTDYALDKNGTAKLATQLNTSYWKYKNITKSDNGGRTTFVLIADVTSWYNDTSGTSENHYGFTGFGIQTRQKGNMRDGSYRVTCRAGYKSSTSISQTLLQLYSTQTSTICPMLVQYDSKYYLALKLSGSGRTFSLFGNWINTLETFTELLTPDGGTLPDGLTVITTGVSMPWEGNATSATNDKNGNDITTTYVKQVSGKGLSTNDFTTTYKTTIDNLSNNYAAKTHNHDSTYLKLSGGTVTGKTKFSNALVIPISAPTSSILENGCIWVSNAKGTTPTTTSGSGTSTGTINATFKYNYKSLLDKTFHQWGIITGPSSIVSNTTWDTGIIPIYKSMKSTDDFVIECTIEGDFPYLEIAIYNKTTEAFGIKVYNNTLATVSNPKINVKIFGYMK